MSGTIEVTELSHNLLSWMVQTVVIAGAAALLPIVFRVRHPRTQLFYCHAVLALCLLLPLIQPWRTTPGSAGSMAWLAFVALHGRWLFGILAAGVVLQMALLSGALWRTRRYRIAATPLYPIPEAMRAAAAITHADALFCVSDEAAGPVMLGWLAPVVLLPASFLSLDEEAQCGIACHELLHVRRGDWLISLIEGFAGALLWFNPGAWLLLSEARLAREQLVDAESVRLTASRESYIDALLAIARGHVWSDLAAAPSFLRRSHLTQRMQSLLSDTPASARRLAGSFCSIAALLGCTIWITCVSFPMLGQPASAVASAHEPTAASEPAMRNSEVAALATPSVPVPAQAVRATESESQPAPAYVDDFEPVNGSAAIESSPTTRASAVALLSTAREGALRHAQGMPPYRFDVTFVAGGNALNVGSGEITETWMTGQKWRWTVSLGDISHTQLLSRGQVLEDKHVAVIPMRAHMLRNEVLWATRWFGPNARLRIAEISWQGKPATCVLGSAPGQADSAMPAGRSWDEEEYCIDDSTGELMVHSIVPGTYAQFGYDAHLQFHGLHIPDRIRIYVAGALAVDGSLRIADTTAADEASLTPTNEVSASGQPLGLGAAFRMRADSQHGQGGNAPQRVIVHAEIDGDGNVIETEISAATDPGPIPAALEHVRLMNHGHTGTERQGYIEVRFTQVGNGRGRINK
jgi:BlaR1 peptidase M56